MFARALVLCLVMVWSSSAAANHDGLAEGIAMMLAFVGAGILFALSVLLATIWFIVRARTGPSKHVSTWCMRFAFIDGLLAASCAVLFVVTGAAGDSVKLLVPLVVFALAAAGAWKTART